MRGNQYTLLLCLGVLLAPGLAWPCDTKRPAKPGSANIGAEKVFFDLSTGDVELLIELKGKTEPFAILWPLEANQEAPSVQVSDGAIFASLDSKASPQLSSNRCDTGKHLGKSVIIATPAAAPAEIESAVVENKNALDAWFQAGGFEEPDEAGLFHARNERQLAIRITPAHGETRAALKLHFEDAPNTLPRLAAYGIQSALDLTWYIQSSQPVSLSGVPEVLIDRDALAAAGLSRFTFDSSYTAAGQALSQNGPVMIKDSSLLVSPGVFLSRFHGWLEVDALPNDLGVVLGKGALLSPQISYCAEARTYTRDPDDDPELPGGDPVAEDEGSRPVPGSGPITDGAGGCSTSPVSTGGSLALFLGLVVLLRARRLWVALLALLAACSPQLNGDTDNPPACTPSAFCAADGLLHTISCDGAQRQEVVSSCGAFGCNAAAGACEVCQPNELSCDNNQLSRCNADGLGASLVESCELGCSPNGASCASVSASHVPTTIQQTAGVGDLSLQATNGQPTRFFINADTGEIRRDDLFNGTVIRAAGSGIKAGIAFTVVPQEDPVAPSLGVFVVRSLNIGENVTLRAFLQDRPAAGKAANALVIISQTDALIAGVIDASAGEFTALQRQQLAQGLNPKAFSKLRNPGPGGYTGGEAGKAGDGPGAGSSPGNFGLNAGGNGGLGFMAGGGGGAFAGVGGSGGVSFRNVAGGSGGFGYGDDALSILIGGSGGGGGANDPHFENPVQGGGVDNPNTRNGGEGGGGGGAVQISALGANGVQLLDEAGINVGGAGGRHLSNDFCCHPGAGGGGAGGAILLEGKRVIIGASAFLTANGGAGAGADLLRSDDCCDGASGSSNTSPASGGVGNGLGGNGGAGTDFNGKVGQLSQTTVSLSFTEGQRGSGSGGGGGVGRIRINTISDQTFDATGAILSPTTTFFTRGSLPLR